MCASKYVVIFRQKNRKKVYKNNLLVFYFSNIEYTTVYIYNYDECLQIVYNVNCNINEFQHLFKMLNIRIENCYYLFIIIDIT